MKTAICSCICLENLYLREWVEHYISLGFDKIILFDTNTIYGEYPQIVINDYIQSGYVDVINKRVYEIPENFVEYQATYYNECLDIYGNEYEWIAFFDIDEFLELTEYKNIKNLLNTGIYEDYEQICITWMLYDNDKYIFNYENKPVLERFPKRIDCRLNCGIKSIIRGNIDKRFVYKAGSPHRICKANSCTGDGYPIYWNNDIEIDLNSSYINNMYIKHIMFKSFEEFLIRRLNTDVFLLQDRLIQYKTCIGWTSEHQKMYEEFVKYMNNK